MSKQIRLIFWDSKGEVGRSVNRNSFKFVYSGPCIYSFTHYWSGEKGILALRNKRHTLVHR